MPRRVVCRCCQWTLLTIINLVSGHQRYMFLAGVSLKGCQNQKSYFKLQEEKRSNGADRAKACVPLLLVDTTHRISFLVGVSQIGCQNHLPTLNWSEKTSLATVPTVVRRVCRCCRSIPKRLPHPVCSCRNQTRAGSSYFENLPKSSST